MRNNYPRWNHTFEFIHPPSPLVSCPILWTDIVRLEIEHRPQYFVIMLRKLAGGGEGGEPILYITAYDPRTAKEYTCKDMNQRSVSWPLRSNTSEKEDNDISRIKAISAELTQLIKVRRNTFSSSYVCS